ncbi:MAG: thioredoxin family protein [Phycisphaerales bacterium]
MHLARSILVGAPLVLLAAVASAQPAPQPGERKPLVPVAKTPVYDESADAKAQIAAALAAARRDHTRVLIQWGGNWCPWCIRLDELMKSDKAVAKAIQYEYKLVHVDCGRPNGKNMGLAAGYGASGMRGHGFPFLTVLDEDGKPIANRETRTLELDSSKGQQESLKAGHDPKALLKFLDDHKAPAPDAQALLDAAVAKAGKEGKRVFVHYGAPWCVWCRRLETWMARPEVAALLAKDFVDLRIDTDRYTGGSALLKKHRKSDGGGIPWFAFLDDKAGAIADSDGPEGNIGFPATAAEVEHFAAMLNKVRRNMTESDVKALIDSLKAESDKGRGH